MICLATNIKIDNLNILYDNYLTSIPNMNFNFIADRQSLYYSLQKMINIIDGKTRIPILGHILLEVNKNYLSLTSTDLEMEIITQILLTETFPTGSITIPGRKFFEICRSLSKNSKITLSAKNNKISVQSGSSNFLLSTFTSSDFPKSETGDNTITITISSVILKKIIELTQFSMANQDPRHYLNGMFFSIEKNTVKIAATNGHRLATCETSIDIIPDPSSKNLSVIIPRKGIIEILRLLHIDTNEIITLKINNNCICMETKDYIFTSKLIDATFPNYHNILITHANNILEIECSVLKQTLKRVAILSNEKNRIVKFTLTTNYLIINAHNFENETSEESLKVSYSGKNIKISFNVDYILDTINVMENQTTLRFLINDETSSVQIESIPQYYKAKYIIMPIRI